MFTIHSHLDVFWEQVFTWPLVPAWFLQYVSEPSLNSCVFGLISWSIRLQTRVFRASSWWPLPPGQWFWALNMLFRRLSSVRPTWVSLWFISIRLVIQIQIYWIIKISFHIPSLIVTLTKSGLIAAPSSRRSISKLPQEYHIFHRIEVIPRNDGNYGLIWMVDKKMIFELVGEFQCEVSRRAWTVSPLIPHPILVEVMHFVNG